MVEIHNFNMRRLGSQPASLNFPDRLESAINYPRDLARYSSVDLVAQAAMLAAGISQAQAFGDGNKRTALGVADAFLGINGAHFYGDRVTLSCWLISIAGYMNNENDDLEKCSECFGLDLAAELDFLASIRQREKVIEMFTGWLRLHVISLDPDEDFSFNIAAELGRITASTRSVQELAVRLFTEWLPLNIKPIWSMDHDTQM